MSDQPIDPLDPVDPANGEPPASLIVYPSDFPITIMGPTNEHFAHTIVGVVKQFDPDFDPATLEIRPSSKGNYLALTATVRATSRQQLDDLYRALSSHAMVKVVL